jgi:hypothetical protein
MLYANTLTLERGEPDMTKLIAIAAVIGASLGGGIVGVTAATKVAPTCCANPCPACADGCDGCDLCLSGDCSLCCGVKPTPAAPARTAGCRDACCAPGATPVGGAAPCCDNPCAACADGCDGCDLCLIDCSLCCGAAAAK